MDERDAQSSVPETPPPELATLDVWLRRDGERWRGGVPSHEALTKQAWALATLAPPPAEPPQRPRVISVPDLDDSGSRRYVPPRRRGRFPAVLAAIAAVLIVGLMVAVVLGATGAHPGIGTSVTPTATVPPAATSAGTPLPTATTATTPTQSPGSFSVTSVIVSVNPTDIAGKKCGTYLTVTYTATFHLAPNGPGGTIQFEYTVNNGRGSNLASITVSPGQTTATYVFSWAGNLPSDHTAPEGGGVVVHSPNNVTSGLVGPSGRCS